MAVGYQIIFFIFLAIEGAVAFESDYTESNPRFAEAVPNITAVEGSNVTISCVVESLGPYKVTWVQMDKYRLLTRDIHIITRDKRFSILVRQRRIWSLRIRNVQVADSGPYLCQLNTSPMKSNVGFLHVVELSSPYSSTLPYDSSNSTANIPPKIWIPSSHEAAVIGRDATLRCYLKSKPMSMTYWTRDGGRFIFMSNTKYSSSIVDIGFNNVKMSLIIRNVGPDDFGSYTCLAKNSVGETEGTITLCVPPIIAIPNQLVEAAIGSNVTLVCNLMSFPRSLFYWTREGSRFMVISNTKYNSHLIDMGKNTEQMRLTIKKVSPDDFGSYSCVAKSSVGEAEGNITLYEIPEPLTNTSSEGLGSKVADETPEPHFSTYPSSE